MDWKLNREHAVGACSSRDKTKSYASSGNYHVTQKDAELIISGLVCYINELVNTRNNLKELYSETGQNDLVDAMEFIEDKINRCENLRLLFGGSRL